MAIDASRHLFGVKKAIQQHSQWKMSKKTMRNKNMWYVCVCDGPRCKCGRKGKNENTKHKKHTEYGTIRTRRDRERMNKKRYKNNKKCIVCTSYCRQFLKNTGAYTHQRKSETLQSTTFYAQSIFKAFDTLFSFICARFLSRRSFLPFPNQFRSSSVFFLVSLIRTVSRFSIIEQCFFLFFSWKWAINYVFRTVTG